MESKKAKQQKRKMHPKSRTFQLQQMKDQGLYVLIESRSKKQHHLTLYFLYSGILYRKNILKRIQPENLAGLSNFEEYL